MKKIINPNEYGALLFDDKEKKAVNEVLRNEKIFRYATDKSSKVDIFEKELRDYVNVKYALGVINGTAGLITALKGCNIKENDRVLVSSFTFLATALAVKQIGAIPIPIEIDLKYGLNIDDLKKEIKKGCKAIIVVQLQGRCFDLSKVKKIAKENGVYLIEDSCQALGARYKNNYAGTIGDVGVYSFQQFKQIACGEGGAIVTNNNTIYDKMRNYSDMGSTRELFPSWNSDNALFGQNYRMNNIQGAILIEQIKKLDFIIKKQMKSRDYIMQNISNKRIINSIYPTGDTGMNILVELNSKEHFNKLKQLENKTHIEIRRMWNGLYYENELFKRNKLTSNDTKGKDCTITKRIIDKLGVISIPPVLNKKECDMIIKFINDYCI